MPKHINKTEGKYKIKRVRPFVEKKQDKWVPRYVYKFFKTQN